MVKGQRLERCVVLVGRLEGDLEVKELGLLLLVEGVGGI
jgi:hypothetical protein